MSRVTITRRHNPNLKRDTSKCPYSDMNGCWNVEAVKTCCNYSITKGAPTMWFNRKLWKIQKPWIDISFWYLFEELVCRLHSENMFFTLGENFQLTSYLSNIFFDWGHGSYSGLLLHSCTVLRKWTMETPCHQARLFDMPFFPSILSWPWTIVSIWMSIRLFVVVSDPHFARDLAPFFLPENGILSSYHCIRVWRQVVITPPFCLDLTDPILRPGDNIADLRLRCSLRKLWRALQISWTMSSTFLLNCCTTRDRKGSST